MKTKLCHVQSCIMHLSVKWQTSLPPESLFTTESKERLLNNLRFSQICTLNLLTQCKRAHAPHDKRLSQPAGHCCQPHAAMTPCLHFHTSQQALLGFEPFLRIIPAKHCSKKSPSRSSSCTHLHTALQRLDVLVGRRLDLLLENLGIKSTHTHAILSALLT